MSDAAAVSTISGITVFMLGTVVTMAFALFSRLDKRIDRLEDKFDGRFVALEDRVDARFERVDAALATLHEDLTVLRATS